MLSRSAAASRAVAGLVRMQALQVLPAANPPMTRGMAKKSIRRKETVPKHPGYDIDEAVKLVKSYSARNFDETVDIAVNTSADPKKPNQQVRGIAKLPHGSGQSVKIAVFARGAKAEEAKAAGAHVVGAEDLAKLVEAGTIDFNRCIATPDMMPVVGRLGRVLGPRGLMPNPKLGTVTNDVKAAIKDAAQGQVEFRAEKEGIVHSAVGKVSFTHDKLKENITEFLKQLDAGRPAGAKGTFLMSTFISSTMGPGIKIDIHTPEFRQLLTGFDAAAANAAKEAAKSAAPSQAR